MTGCYCRVLPRFALLLVLAACSGGTGTGAQPPPRCHPEEATQLVTSFLEAFNRGDEDQLARFFPTHLRWYSVTDAGPDGQQRHFVTHRRAPLLAYFRERQQQHEQLQLRKLWVNSNDSTGESIDIWYFLTRRADDLPTGFGGPEGLATGKGAIHCPTQTIYVWSMGQRPEAPPGVQLSPMSTTSAP